MTDIYYIMCSALVMIFCGYVLTRIIILRRRIKRQNEKIDAKSYLLQMAVVANEHVNEEQLKQAQINAEKAIAKGRGINNFDVVIRPLLDNVINGAKRIVEADNSKEERHELGLDITRDVKNLSDNVENVLLMARIDSKRIDYDNDKIEVSGLVGSIYEEFNGIDGSQFSHKDGDGCRLGIIEGRQSLCIAADQLYLTKALREVVKNAFTFSRHGDIFIGWFYRLGTSEVEIFVEDNGVGISPEKQEQVFDVFYKGEDSTGMGLGLSLAKELVEKMGGRIALVSHPGIGTRVTILFPSV